MFSATHAYKFKQSFSQAQSAWLKIILLGVNVFGLWKDNFWSHILPTESDYGWKVPDFSAESLSLSAENFSFDTPNRWDGITRDENRCIDQLTRDRWQRWIQSATKSKLVLILISCIAWNCSFYGLFWYQIFAIYMRKYGNLNSEVISILK